MEGRGEQAGGDQAERQREADQPQGEVRRSQAEGTGDAQQEQQAVAGAGGGGEEDDGGGGMHRGGLRQRDSTASTQASIRPPVVVGASDRKSTRLNSSH